MRVFIIAMLLPLTVNAASITGMVVGVTDGDTVTLLDNDKQQHKIRLSGIDAPEKAQAFGTKSKQSLSDCAYNQTATIEYSKRDRYRRIVGKVLVRGHDCNLHQIRSGMAWHYKKYADEQPADERAIYAEQEQLAKSRKIGLWSETDAIPPWEYRKRK
jgi:endonuclease YncB( thermonuclease family)